MDTENLKKSEESSRTSESVKPDDPEYKVPAKKKKRKNSFPPRQCFLGLSCWRPY